MLETQTRTFIDQKLRNFWRDVHNHRQVAVEFVIDKNGTKLFADYALLDTDGSVIALIEAKRFTRSARDGQHQAEEYALLAQEKQWYRPFIFLSNGREIYRYNSTQSQAPRKIRTFFTLQDLKRLKFLSETQTPPQDQPIDPDIAGRDYQFAAVKSITEGIALGKRKFLLVMATGTGKTRTAMALIDVMLKTHTAQKILFLCDRTALRDQAFDDGFKAFFDSTPKTTIQTWKTDDNARLYAATYQTMINYLDHYSSGYFDLIIVDEVHKSIYGERKIILDHFDCYQVGLTATPVDFVDRSTYKAFECHENWPTYNYDLDEAITEGYLVPYTVLKIQTLRQIQGIKDYQLPAHVKNQLIKEGKDPEEYNFEGSDIGKKIDNKDTNRVMVREFMKHANTSEDGLPGKTIIFAMNQAHAEHLQETFEELYPHLHQFSVVITSNVERADKLIKSFKQLTTEKKHRVAISVDMLDTGIDVPEVVNLVFAKKVFSETKFWQMIGRGTRLCPNVYGPWQDKQDFLIIDFGYNFDEHHKFKDPGPRALSLQQQYMELKIEQLKLWSNRHDTKQFNRTKKDILTILKSLKDNDETLAHQSLIDQALSESIFDNTAVNPYEHLQILAPLARYYDRRTILELRFMIKSEQLINALIQQEESEALKDKVASDINALSRTISKVQDKEDQIRQVLKPAYRETISIPEMQSLIKEFTPLMKYRDITKPNILTVDLQDEAGVSTRIYYADGKKMESNHYRKVFVDTINEQVQSSQAIQKILENQPLSRQDIAELESKFEQSDYRLNVINLRKVFHTPTADFEKLIRVALGKDTLLGRETEVNQLFEEYLHAHNFSSQQIAFLRIAKALIINNKKITHEDFYTPPFEKQFGMSALDRLFKPEQVQDLMQFVERFSL